MIVFLPTSHLIHECMILPIQHGKLDATKIDTKSAIFANIMIKLKHANGFIDESYMDSEMLHNEMDII